MIKKIADIATVMNDFHDAEIVLETATQNTLTWKINCEFLAELIDPTFDHFWIKVNRYETLRFVPWLKPIASPEEIWETPHQIFMTGLDILSARAHEETVIMSCLQHDPTHRFTGGMLSLTCESIEVFTQEWNSLEFLECKAIFQQYWSKHGR